VTRLKNSDKGSYKIIVAFAGDWDRFGSKASRTFKL
jgi:hypothetical protein